MNARHCLGRPGTRAIAARLALAMALVLAAFAHRPAAATPSGMTALQIARYVLPDGSLPVLCLPGHEGGVAADICEFCLIAGSAAPPGRDACLPVRHRPGADAVGAPAQAGPPVAATHLQTAPSRGPPPAA